MTALSVEEILAPLRLLFWVLAGGMVSFLFMIFLSLLFRNGGSK